MSIQTPLDLIVYSAHMSCFGETPDYSKRGALKVRACVFVSVWARACLIIFYRKSPYIVIWISLFRPSFVAVERSNIEYIYKSFKYMYRIS